MQNADKKIVILGASRGLGSATYQALNLKYPDAQFILSSRKIENCQTYGNTKKIVQDFSKTPVDTIFFNEIKNFNPTEIIYCAGGGPYGNFEIKKWSDHAWALNVNFLYPAQLIYEVLNKKLEFINLKSMTFVGSDIAEVKPDAMASSYCAAKHALKGLVSTLQTEASSKFKIKLFSPGYMATELLPAQSAPRLQNLAENPAEVAKKLVEFLDSDALTWSSSQDR